MGNRFFYRSRNRSGNRRTFQAGTSGWATRVVGMLVPLVVLVFYTTGDAQQATTRPVVQTGSSDGSTDRTENGSKPPPPPTEYRWDNPSYLSIPVTWHGHSGCFIVDTGAAFNAVDAHAFGDLPVDGEVTVGPMFSEAVKLTTCRPPHLSVGPFQLDRCGSVLRHDLSVAPKYDDTPVLGVLGMPAMDCMALQVDFDRCRFRFLPAFSDPGIDWGTAVPLRFELGDVPYLQIRCGKNNVWGTLDTGFSGTAHLASEHFDILPQPTMEPRTIGMWSAEGMSNYIQLQKRLPTVSFVGGPDCHDVTVERGSSQTYVGLGLLSRCSMMTVDVAAKQLYIRGRRQAADQRNDVVTKVKKGDKYQ